MSTDLQSKRIYRYHCDKHFSEFLPTRRRRKSTGIDKEQCDVTVTLCILVTTEFNTIRYDMLVYRAHEAGRIEPNSKQKITKI